jgi:hypothetical protein
MLNVTHFANLTEALMFRELEGGSDKLGRLGKETA